MISRRYLRTKTMQALYAYSMKPYEDVLSAQKELVKTIKNSYVLFLWLFSILPELTYYRKNKLEDLRNKHNPTEEDLNPNTKFVDNQVIEQIEDNVTLKKLFQANKIDWSNEGDFIPRLFHILEETDFYQSYMSNPEIRYEEDKKLVLNIIEKVLATDDHIRWYFSEKETNWLDDFDEALMMLYKNVEKFKAKNGDNNKILPLYKDQTEEEQFVKDLFKKTIQHDAEYEELIEAKLQNWELERVIGMDILLMKMAICEFLECPTIPLKVTMNEYIELAKLYSSEKSPKFINGILDRMIVDFKEQGRIVKTGTGLYQN